MMQDVVWLLEFSEHEMHSFQISWAVAANFALFFTSPTPPSSTAKPIGKSVTCPLRSVLIFSSRSASIHCVRISSSQSHPWRSAFLCRNDVGCCMFQPLSRPTSSARVQSLYGYQVVSISSATLCSLRRKRPAAGAGHDPPQGSIRSLTFVWLSPISCPTSRLSAVAFEFLGIQVLFAAL